MVLTMQGRIPIDWPFVVCLYIKSLIEAVVACVVHYLESYIIHYLELYIIHCLKTMNNFIEI